MATLYHYVIWWKVIWTNIGAHTLFYWQHSISIWVPVVLCAGYPISIVVRKLRFFGQVFDCQMSCLYIYFVHIISSTYVNTTNFSGNVDHPLLCQMFDIPIPVLHSWNEIKTTVMKWSWPERVCVCGWCVLGVRDSGAAGVDPHRHSLLLTIKGSGEPHGVIRFDTASLYTSVNASNTTLSLNVHRTAGTIG